MSLACWLLSLTNISSFHCCEFTLLGLLPLGVQCVFVVLLQLAVFIQKFTKSLTANANRNSGSSRLWLSSNSSIVTSSEFWMEGLRQELLCLLNVVGRNRPPHWRSVEPNFLATDFTELKFSKLNACNNNIVTMPKMLCYLAHSPLLYIFCFILRKAIILIHLMDITILIS